MERCPVCQARLRQDPACPRCKTDLTRLLAIEAEAAVWLRRAAAHLAAGEDALALRAVEVSLRIKREPLAVLLWEFLSAVACLLRGQVSFRSKLKAKSPSKTGKWRSRWVFAYSTAKVKPFVVSPSVNSGEPCRTMNGLTYS